MVYYDLKWYHGLAAAGALALSFIGGCMTSATPRMTLDVDGNRKSLHVNRSGPEMGKDWDGVSGDNFRKTLESLCSTTTPPPSTATPAKDDAYALVVPGSGVYNVTFEDKSLENRFSTDFPEMHDVVYKPSLAPLAREMLKRIDAADGEDGKISAAGYAKAMGDVQARAQYVAEALRVSPALKRDAGFRARAAGLGICL